jgi:ubiquinol-cytochrome c reductase cytochrome c1 subunit
MAKLIRTVLAVAVAVGISHSALANEHGAELTKPGFSFEGVFGRYEPGALKRGFQVFHEVCSNCHSLNLVAYRNLKAIGLSDDEVKAVAAEREIQDGPNDEGQMFMRAARASDHYVPPFANEKAAAAANGGAAPPDLSLMAKARVGGPNYIYSLLQGFEENPPEGVSIPEGKYYNHIFPGHAISMPPQLQDDLVTYADGTKATKAQIANDIVVFLNWAAEPELDARKSLGLYTIAFLALLTALFYALKLQIWKDVH